MLALKLVNGKKEFFLREKKCQPFVAYATRLTSISTVCSGITIHPSLYLCNSFGKWCTSMENSCDKDYQHHYDTNEYTSIELISYD
jgi:hypothetical protein